MNKSMLSFALVSCLMLPGCLHQAKYQPKPLKDAHSRYYASNVHQSDLIVCAKHLTPDQLASIFNQDIKKRLKSNRLESILLSIRNKGEKTWVLDPEAISLPIAPVDYVYNKLKASNAGFILGALTAGIGGIALSSVLFPPASLGFIIGVPIRTTQLCNSTVIANELLEQDLAQKLLIDDVLIDKRPVSKLLFVRRDLLRSEFTIILENATDPEDLVAFRINLAD